MYVSPHNSMADQWSLYCKADVEMGPWSWDPLIISHILWLRFLGPDSVGTTYRMNTWSTSSSEESGRKIVPYLSRFSGWTDNQIDMIQISMRKILKFNNMYTSWERGKLGETEEHWVTGQNGKAITINATFSLRTKDVGIGSQLWEFRRKSTVNNSKIVMQI